jgi:hypothetical protein
MKRTVHHSDDPKPFSSRRIEVYTGSQERRRWPDETKARIVVESGAPAPSLAPLDVVYAAILISGPMAGLAKPDATRRGLFLRAWALRHICGGTTGGASAASSRWMALTATTSSLAQIGAEGR